MTDRADIRVELTMVPSEQGGRRSPVFANYRSQFRYKGRDNDVSITAFELAEGARVIARGRILEVLVGELQLSPQHGIDA